MKPHLWILCFLLSFGLLSPLSPYASSKEQETSASQPAVDSPANSNFKPYSSKTDNTGYKEVCPNRIFLRRYPVIKLSALEKRVVCGDEKVESWSEIPLNQANFFLTNFLQSRGFHHPQFNAQLEGTGESAREKLYVDQGQPTYSSKIEVEANPPFVDMYRKRRVLKKKLTPGLLKEIEGWIRSQVRSVGYACPVIKVEANTDTGEIHVDLYRGPKYDTHSIIQETVPGMGPGALRKFDAFVLDKTFNDDLLELTTKRVQDSGVLQSNFFTWDCEDPQNPEQADQVPDQALPDPPEVELKDLELYQRTFAGKPRLFRIGFGASTEEYAIIRASWKHTRWGENASQFASSLYASYRTQTVDLLADWYAFGSLSRWYVQPLISFTHERQTEFQYISGNMQGAIGYTWDNQEFGLRATFGPNLNFTQTISGARPGLTRFLTMRYEMNLMSHPWEMWQKDPRQGYRVYLGGDFGTEAIYSSISAQRFRLEGQYLYNFRGYDLPLLIIGVRGGFYGTFAGQDDNTQDILPPNYKYYLGGSQNLRGFGLKELPNADGSLSALWTSLEVRLANYIPYWIQPFVFLDVGILGNQAFEFQAPVYYSPGAGIRVASPIGVFRTTFAHGFKSSEADGNLGNTHFQFYITYGEEF